MKNKHSRKQCATKLWYVRAPLRRVYQQLLNHLKREQQKLEPKNLSRHWKK